MSGIIRDTPFPFPDDRFPPELGAVIQRTVIRGELPVLIVIHDEENDWMIGDGITDASGPAASIISHVRHVVELDPTVEETATLPCGYAAHRSSQFAPWVIEPWSYPDENS